MSKLGCVFYQIDVYKRQEHGIDDFSGNVINCTDEKESAEITVRLVRDGKADFLQKGLMQTKTILKAVLNKEYEMCIRDSIFAIGVTLPVSQ